MILVDTPWSLKFNTHKFLQHTFSSSSDLFGESSNDSAGSIVLVEGM